MKYIYDIILNINEEKVFYEYFEWLKKDKIINVRKAPIFKVSSSIINDFINYEIKIDKNFLKIITNKSLFYKKDTKKIDNIVILSNGKKSIGVSFYKNGIIKYISSMVIDEEDEANRIIKNDKEMIIKYKKNKKYINNNIRINNKNNNLLKELNDDYKNKKYDKLRYIYYEIFNEEQKNIRIIYQKLLSIKKYY